ncbi:MAG TPA: S26 family signal peptidase [Poseidonia sp.]|nr:S26 family signal peptidase [Poseidonia sp.]
MSDQDPLKTLVLEIALAVGMIACLVLALFIHTGSMPPLVVVESESMIHDEKGEVGSIDAGDLILVHKNPADTITTFAEATDSNHPSFGYEQHGMEGDVIIYAKNGEDGTPIIHRAILRVQAASITVPERGETNPCPTNSSYDAELIGPDDVLGACIWTWTVPGTSVINASTISIKFDGYDAGFYDCKRPAHGNVESHLVVWNWRPAHEGILTLGDNNQCSVDQGASVTNGSAGVHGESGIVGPIRNDWVLGVAGGELPWIGTVKLMVGGPNSYGTQDVPSSSFFALFSLITLVLISPLITERVFKGILSGAPELKVLQVEDSLKESE